MKMTIELLYYAITGVIAYYLADVGYNMVVNEFCTEYRHLAKMLNRIVKGSTVFVFIILLLRLLNVTIRIEAIVILVLIPLVWLLHTSIIRVMKVMNLIFAFARRNEDSSRVFNYAIRLLDKYQGLFNILIEINIYLLLIYISIQYIISYIIKI